MNSVLVRGGELVLVEKGVIARGDVSISDGKIVRATPFSEDPLNAQQVLDVHGLYVGPGFIDLQVNGGAGWNFGEATAEHVRAIVRFHNAHGTTGMLATLITAPVERLRKALAAITEACCPSILGVHLEGPFIASDKRGAHDPQYLLEPSVQQLRDVVHGYEGSLRIMTLAPELPGAQELIAEVAQMGAIPALGHSDATYEQGLEAIAGGARLVTHLFNAMRGLHHRQPGLAGAALERDVMVSLIADGVHVHPAAILLAIRCKGVERVCLITDAISAAGSAESEHWLGEQRVIVRQGEARLMDGALAGSTLTMDAAVRNALRWTNLSLPQAVRLATLNPAGLLGLDHRKGSIAEGKDADLVIFDEDFRVHYTLMGGEIIAGKNRHR